MLKEKGTSNYLYHGIPHFLCRNMVFSRKTKYRQDCHVHILSFTGSNSKSNWSIILCSSAIYTSLSACRSITWCKRIHKVDIISSKEMVWKTYLWCRSTPDTPSSPLTISQDQTLSTNNPKGWTDIKNISTDILTWRAHWSGLLNDEKNLQWNSVFDKKYN